ncbi:hypothetical protein SBV1_560003 [Verrucomicrobia bacterium]|nr:hypothetical protein SBV1_560003 [Verrucomicrobiota bacterium]
MSERPLAELVWSWASSSNQFVSASWHRAFTSPAALGSEPTWVHPASKSAWAQSNNLDALRPNLGYFHPYIGLWGRGFLTSAKLNLNSVYVI